MSTPAKYKAAVIGVGKPNQPFMKGGGHAIGHVHAQMFKRNPRIDLVAGGDINAENLEYYRKTFEVPRGYLDYREMLKEEKPDVVSIGTYVGLHRKILEDCARAGVKGILCEKPFLNAPADIAPVRELVAETGVKIVVGHVRRYMPAVQRLRELIRDGVIGQVVSYMTGIEGWDLSEMGAHAFDLIRHFHGDRPVKWVFGQARVRALRGYGHAMEDHAIAYFEFEDGARGIIDGGRGLPNGINFLIAGTAGTVRVMKEDRLVIDTIAGQRTESFVGDPEGTWPALWDKLLRDLIRWVEGGAAPLVGFESAVQTLAVNQAAYISAILRDRVDLPLAGEALQINQYPVELLAGKNEKSGQAT
jgi:predicted dehydrogenase